VSTVGVKGSEKPCHRHCLPFPFDAEQNNFECSWVEATTVKL
jgi:hypothetical protein